MGQLTWSKKYAWSRSLTWNGECPNQYKIVNHVSFNFAEFKDAELLERSGDVHDAMVANVAQTTGCPVTAVALDTANTDFGAKIAATQQGGKASTLDKKASREALVSLLRQIGMWLDGKAQGNVDTITLFHFDYVTRGPHAQSPLAIPVIKAILNLMTTQLKLRVTAVPNAYSYVVEYRVGTGPWTPGGTFTDSRGMVVTGLTPGTLYEFRVRAVGGNNTMSDYSDTVTHMCM